MTFPPCLACEEPSEIIGPEEWPERDGMENAVLSDPSWRLMLCPRCAHIMVWQAHDDRFRNMTGAEAARFIAYPGERERWENTVEEVFRRQNYWG